MGLKEGFEAVLVTLAAAIVLIIVGVIFFGVTLWIINVASGLFFGAGLEANWAVLSASLLSVGALIAGALSS